MRNRVWLSTVLLFSSITLSGGCTGVYSPQAKYSAKSASQHSRAFDEISVGCTTEKGYRSVEIFSDGVAIWKDARQFALTDSEVHAVLQAFERFDFASMPDMYGGSDKGSNDETPPQMEGQQGEGGADRIRVTCSAQFDSNKQSKRVVQLHIGEQSAELRGLADAVLDICEGPAAAGTTATSLADGFDKLASGQLAAQSLRLKAFLGIEGAPAERADSGWLLRIDGLEASTRNYTSAGYDTPHTLRLTQAEFVELMQRLSVSNPGDWPDNLYAGQYTQLSVAVLGQKKNILARQFARMQPTTHGEAQRQFDETFAVLTALHQRILSEGVPGN